MNYVNLEIGYDLIKELIEKTGGFQEVRIERKNDILNLILTSKVMGFVKIPVSIKFKLKRAQSFPSDPLVFSIDTMSMVKKIIQEHSGKMFEYDRDELRVHPDRAFSLFKKMVIFDLNFEEDRVSMKVKPFDMKVET